MNIVSADRYCICVTGASGFIGRQVVDCLIDSEHEVRVGVHSRTLNLANVSEYAVDLERRRQDSSFLVGADVLVHVAGLAHTYGIADEHYRAVTVEGGRWLFEAAAKAGVRRIVLVSSCKAGFEFGQKVDETCPDMPQSMYGRYKLAQEQALREIAAEHNIEFVVLRPSLVYGVGVAGNLATWLKRSRYLAMPAMPAGGRRSMVSVGDLAAAVVLACLHDGAHNKTYYVADGESYDVHGVDAAIRLVRGHKPRKPSPLWLWHVVAVIGGLAMRAGMDLGIDPLRLMNLLKDSTCSSRRLQDELGWVPQDRFYSLVNEMLAAADKRQS